MGRSQQWLAALLGEVAAKLSFIVPLLAPGLAAR